MNESQSFSEYFLIQPLCLVLYFTYCIFSMNPFQLVDDSGIRFGIRITSSDSLREASTQF
jgi:hypothetical protein